MDPGSSTREGVRTGGDGPVPDVRLEPLDFALSDRDVRSRRPASLGFLLKLDTLRRLARVVSLLAIDFAGIFGAILTALLLKAALKDDWHPSQSYGEAKDTVAFGYLVAVLLFARSDLYADRAARPGLTRIVA